LQKEAPIKVEYAHYLKWIAGVKGGGSGIDLFINVSEKIPLNILFDSVYFRGMVTKLEVIDGEFPLLVGRFKTAFNNNQDIVLSDNPNEEYSNPAPKFPNKIPFDLKDSECVISYKNGDDSKYFKVDKIVEKQPEHYPSAAPNND
jgi:hypothetical protein